jgi:hypothetical protein
MMVNRDQLRLGPAPNPAKVNIFQPRVCWYSIDQKFHAIGEKTLKFQF